MVAGCDTTSQIAPYTASTPNVVALQGALKPSGAMVKVGDFSGSPWVADQRCRFVGSLDVTSGKTLPDYIRDAMQTELFTAQVYDENSKVVINGRVDEVKQRSWGLLSGQWTLGLQVTSNRDPVGYHIEVAREFKTSFFAGPACWNAMNAFAPTVRDLLAAVVKDPRFAKLAGKTS